MSLHLTVPLVILAFFAVVAGFVGVNPGFWLLGPALNGINIHAPFAHWVGQTLLEPPPVAPFVIWPVVISFGVFILGAYAGWQAYKARANTVDATDPVAEVIGPSFYRLIANKYYIDQLYQRFVVNPATWLSNVFAPKWVDDNVIGRILSAIVAAAIFTGNIFRAFNTIVIDGVGDGIPEAVNDLGSHAKSIQDGHIQRYLLYALGAALIVGANLALIVVASGDLTRLVMIAEAVIGVLVIFLGTQRSVPTSGGD